YPANVQEVLDFGIHGWAMSRYSGAWVAFKNVAEVLESTASVSADPDRVKIALPNNFAVPEGGLSIRWPDAILAQEERLQKHKIYAALAYARTNGLDRTVIDSPKPRLGIITAGKTYTDVRQALDDLGIDEKLARKIGIRLYKVGLVWPIEADGVREFAHGLEEVVVVEEKRALVENQLKEQLYNWDEGARPRVVGKFDEKGDWLLPADGELTPGMIARVLGARIAKFFPSDAIAERLAFLDRKEKALQHNDLNFERTPY
ncbi:MAG: indolepyruvate ferredoxin oxidoreductase family protein, partial [bacterium]|nr:indolepyruvate ferredoxin oxidoreductase family protein [bacterium]